MNKLDDREDIVMNILRSRFGSRLEIHRETPLFEGGLGIDSIEFLELLLEIERVSGKILRNETLTEEAVANVGGLIQYVLSLEPR